jgi:hypothetical protein
MELNTQATNNAANMILFERIKNATVTCVLVDDNIEFNVVQKSIAKVGSDGIIEIS